MTASNPADVMAVIARRGGILRSVGTDGIGKRELVDRVDVSRSTVDRSVRELEAKGLIERTGNGYRRTLVGELALSEYDTFAARVSGLVEHADVLDPLPADAAVDAAMFDDAEVVRAERHSPHEPVTALCDLLADADTVRAVQIAVFPRVMETYFERIARGLEADLVLAPGAAERLIGTHDEALADALGTGRLDVRQADREPEFGLLVAETSDGPVAGVVLFGDSGVRAFVRNDDSDAVAWARSRLDEAWATATSIPTPS